MSYRQATIRSSSRKSNNGPEPRSTRTSLSTAAPSLMLAALMFASPPINLRNRSSRNRSAATNQRTIRWAAEALSPAADLTAAAAAAVLRKNVISGAAIFAAGDAAAQLLTSPKFATEAPPAAVAAPPAPVREEGVEGRAAAPHRGRAARARLFPARVASLDLNRLGISVFLGAIWSGFVVPIIYGNVEKTFPGKASLGQILVKVLVTCSILSTIGNYATMFARRFIGQYTTYQFDRNSSRRLKWWSSPIQSALLFLAIFQDCFKSCNRDIREVIVDDLKVWPLYDLACYSLIPPSWRAVTTSIMSSGWAMYMSIASAKGEREEKLEEELDSFDVAVIAVPTPVVPAPREQPEGTGRATPPAEDPRSDAGGDTATRIISVSAAAGATVPSK